MSKILEMRENRKKAWEAAKAFVETKRDKDGLLSEVDAKTYAEMEKKVQALFQMRGHLPQGCME